VKDIQAAVAALAGAGRVGAVGYCWGGSLAWLTATRLKVDCAVCYYGGQINDFVAEQPRCPVLLHFGEKDGFIPNEHWARIRSEHPALELHTYPAGHGFNCEQRGDFHAESARLARQRTLAFFRSHLD
jgi:carboxymethylenebutenolidase